jgi:hypothetical protein
LNTCEAPREEVISDLAAYIRPQMQAAWTSGGFGSASLGDDAYIQWGKWPEGMQVECNVSWERPGAIEFVQRRALVELGFSSPQSSDHPNYLIRFHSDTEIPYYAELLARAAVKVHGWSGTTDWQHQSMTDLFATVSYVEEYLDGLPEVDDDDE